MLWGWSQNNHKIYFRMVDQLVGVIEGIWDIEVICVSPHLFQVATGQRNNLKVVQRLQRRNMTVACPSTRAYDADANLGGHGDSFGNIEIGSAVWVATCSAKVIFSSAKLRGLIATTHCLNDLKRIDRFE
ncbi:hypothetical protein D9M71_793300 [compost metagenome]